MRLITGISTDCQTFYMYLPSEPILVLGAVNILYNIKDVKCLGQVLDTFNKQLCSSGLVGKGLTGELGAQILLLLACDFVAPVDHLCSPNLLRPVHLLTVIDVLFGKTMWVGTNGCQEAYDKASRTAYMNSLGCDKGPSTRNARSVSSISWKFLYSW